VVEPQELHHAAGGVFADGDACVDAAVDRRLGSESGEQVRTGEDDGEAGEGDVPQPPQLQQCGGGQVLGFVDDKQGGTAVTYSRASFCIWRAGPVAWVPVMAVVMWCHWAASVLAWPGRVTNAVLTSATAATASRTVVLPAPHGPEAAMEAPRRIQAGMPAAS
jgi:hypothetical protein